MVEVKKSGLKEISRNEELEINGGGLGVAALKVGAVVGQACGLGPVGGLVVVGVGVVAIGAGIYAGYNR